MIKSRFERWLTKIIKFDRDITRTYDAYNKGEFPEITAKEARENLTLYKAKQIIEGEKYINQLFGKIITSSKAGCKCILSDETGSEDFLTPQFLENKIKPYFENRGYKVEIVWDTTGYTYAYAKIMWGDDNE